MALPKQQKINDYSRLELHGDVEMFFEKRIEYSGTSPIYIGYVRTPNASQSALVWYIVKLTNDGSGNPTRIQLPDRGPQFKYSWTDRATYFS